MVKGDFVKPKHSASHAIVLDVVTKRGVSIAKVRMLSHAGYVTSYAVADLEPVTPDKRDLHFARLFGF